MINCCYNAWNFGKFNWECNRLAIVREGRSINNSPLLNTYCNITIRYSPRCLIVIAFKFGFAYCISDRAITAVWCFPRDNLAMPALFSKGEHKRMLLYCACTFAISPLLNAYSIIPTCRWCIRDIGIKYG